MHELPSFDTPVRYREEILAELICFGAAPGADTQPRVVYQFLRALMTFEVRGLKAGRRELERVFGPQPLDDYARQIDLLRDRYALLRRSPSDWLEPPGQAVKS